jgi:hypothetical protein
MFEIIRRIFGRQATRSIAVIRARLSSDRAQRGTLEAFFANGETASGPWPAATIMDVGDYVADATGFDVTGALKLNPRRDERSSALPAASTALRGGDVFRMTPDHSLRVPPPAIAELREYLSSGRLVRVEVVESAMFKRWSEAPDRVGSRGRRSWIARLRRGDAGASDGGDAETGDREDRDGDTDNEPSFAPQDAAAAAALVAAGFVVGGEMAAEAGAQSADAARGAYSPSGGSYDR